MNINMKNYALYIGGAAILIALVFWVLNTRVANAPEGVVCTMEAKQCPDGSYVGRTGPSCEFAACPSTANGPFFLKARLGQEVSVAGVRLVLQSIVEDSRCPANVQCIQAGTVKVSALLSSGLGKAVQTFTLGQPTTTEAETVTLTNVAPQKVSGTEIKKSDYIFTFEIVKRAATTGGTAGARCGGFIKDAPTCAQGFHCQLTVNSPDTGGTCVADTAN